MKHIIYLIVATLVLFPSVVFDQTKIERTHSDLACMIKELPNGLFRIGLIGSRLFSMLCPRMFAMLDKREKIKNIDIAKTNLTTYLL